MSGAQQGPSETEPAEQQKHDATLPLAFNVVSGSLMGGQDNNHLNLCKVEAGSEAAAPPG